VDTPKSKVFNMRKKALQWHQNTNRSGLGSSAAAKVEILAVAAEVEIQHADWDDKLAGEIPLPT
jgi:hypothetical protein